jgi:hypothetical protein
MKAGFHLKRLAQNGFVTQSGAVKNSVDPLFSPEALSPFFPVWRNFAMLVLKGVTHMDNGQGSCGGSLN